MFTNNEIPVLGILRGIRESEIMPLVEIFSTIGIRYIEITMNTEGAADIIKQVIQVSREKLVIGAGTVLNEADLDNALNAGAKFVVTPSVKEELVIHCVQHNIPVFPGALTPTEVQKAWDLGATMVKLFPSGLYGPGYIRALKGPFDKIKIMAVGGINEQNVSKYFSHGADAVAFGAGILRPDWLEEKRFGMIEEKLKQFVENCKPE